WPIGEWSGTHTPAEWRKGVQIMSLKSFNEGLIASRQESGIIAVETQTPENFIDMGDGTFKAVWTTKFQNNLPDSSFAYIEAGGTKDADGKTTPRSLRHFPFKNFDGKPDAAHVRNALARIPQSSLPQGAKDAA